MTFNSTLALLLLTTIALRKPPEYNPNPHPQLVNTSFVLDIIGCVHVKYNFKNFVFFISEQLGTNSEIFLEFFQDFWTEFPVVPSTIISNNNEPHKMDEFLSTPSICFVFTSNVDDPIMEVAARSLKGIRVMQTIFVLFPILPNSEFYESLESFNRFSELIHIVYAWIWKKQFLNTILLTIQNNIYILEPYPIPTVVNKTVEWYVDDFFIDYDDNFKGYVVDIPVRYDLPRAFPMHYIESPDKSKRVLDKMSGTSALLFEAFIKSINATIIDTSIISMNPEGFDINFIIHRIEEKTLEISLHSFTFMTDIPIGSSYPIGINDWCIMVPFRNRSPDHLFLQRTMQSSTWILILFSGLYITICIWLCMPENSRDLSASCLQTVCSLLYIAPTSVFQSKCKRIRWLFFLLFLFGFILSNMFVTRLASYLTSSPYQSQIDSVDDVIDEKLQVMVLDFEYKILAELPQFPSKFVDLLIIVDKFTMNKYRDNLNTSYGYSVPTDRWKFIDRQQRNLRKPLFRLSQICLGPYYHMFPMQVDSHFRSRLKAFLMIASEAGFPEVWEKSTFADALKLKYVRMMMVYEEPIPLSMHFFRPIWVAWCCGMTSAGIIFAMEIKWLTLVGWGRKMAKIWRSLFSKFCGI